MLTSELCLSWHSLKDRDDDFPRAKTGANERHFAVVYGLWHARWTYPRLCPVQHWRILAPVLLSWYPAVALGSVELLHDPGDPGPFDHRD